MLEGLYHTWAGGLIVHIIFVPSWVVGGLLPALACKGLASRTYGLSFLIFANVGIEKIQTQRIVALAHLALCALCGPRTPSEAGFAAYWLSFVAQALMGYINWFSVMKANPNWVKLLQDLDFTKYYAECDLRGELEDIQKERTLFAFHPHGILTSGFSLNGCWNKRFRELAGTDTQFLVDKVLRRDNPVFKTVCDLHGGLGCLNKTDLLKMMGRQQNVAFLPGGFEDATLMAFGKERTAIKKRTGFIKYALQNGYRVQPCYTFGESCTHYTYTGALDFRLWLNKFGIPAVAMFGWPFCPIMPRPEARILTYVGKALELPKIAEPSREDVAKWHAKYCDALVEVFEKNKKGAGLPASAKLEIM
jgi:2-acylglycerol O-acyltransferase 2